MGIRVRYGLREELGRGEAGGATPVLAHMTHYKCWKLLKHVPALYSINSQLKLGGVLKPKMHCKP